ncbi:MAG: extracellular solute-binding protein [Pseudomonadota bacterium]
MVPTKIVRLLFVLAASAWLTACGDIDAPSGSDERPDAEATEPNGQVNVYSGRHYESDSALFRQFTEETGIKVNLIEARGDALIERLAREGEASPADIFMTADAGVLWRAEQKDLFQPIEEESILTRVPEQFQHPEGLWVGVSKRARIIIYNKAAGLPEGLTDYLGLASPDLGEKICVRSSSNVYNQSLLASLIANHGEQAARDWAAGVVANFARRPSGNDTAQIEAVAAGDCDLGIVNSYYVARYVGSDDAKNKMIAGKIGVLFPAQETTGTHVNISGLGVTRHAPNKAEALALIEFLLRENSQSAFARGNNEYPVVTSVEATGPIAKLGAFVEDDLSVAELGENQPLAVAIFEDAGWL